MNIHDLVSELILDTRGGPGGWKESSLYLFMPELILCATILLMLLVRLFNWGRRVDTFYITLFGAAAALYFAAPWELRAGEIVKTEIFTGMLVYDTFSVFVRSLLILFLLFFAVLTKLTGLPDKEDGPDIYTLVIGATIGMCLMVTANHLLMVFMAVEMASVPSYALAGMLKGRRQSSEAALKYSVYGAGAAGVMLYGVSLVAGVLNTVHLPTMAVRLAQMNIGHTLSSSVQFEELAVLVLGAMMIMIGLAFKLSAVPFHFWCPDVFEGAAAEVGAFLSVASKAAALALLVRVAIGFGSLPSDSPKAAQADAAQPTVQFVSTAADEENQNTSHASGEGGATQSTPLSNQSLYVVRDFLAKLIAFLAVITCTFGNLAAYGQTNIKRLMAYSTIAHAGYMMMPVAAVLAMIGLDTQAARDGVAALCLYMFIYLFMNLGAFAIIAFLRNAMRSEEIRHYAGLIRHCPGTVIAMSLLMFGLIGLPPLAGFIGKFAIFASLMDAYNVATTHGAAGGYLITLLVVGGLNTAVSLFYYLRVVKVMTMDPDPEDRLPVRFAKPWAEVPYIWVLTLATVVLFFFWDTLNQVAQKAANHFLT